MRAAQQVLPRLITVRSAVETAPDYMCSQAGKLCGPERAKADRNWSQGQLGIRAHGGLRVVEAHATWI